METSPAASNTQVYIRPAVLEDAPGVAALLQALGYPCSAEEAAVRLLNLREEPEQQLWIAQEHGEAIAMIAMDIRYYLPLGARTCRITALVVLDAFHGRGIGKRLLREAEQKARQAGASRVELTTALHREQAHLFYKACGYENASLRFVKRLGDA
ncbi:MAG TPA: GNAT family N-acetyltransferase [Arenimonas sp.]|jgi:GNAT superfamily N-acetyltransferase|nr:GNAT family N-acetyltransferase [Arenimonas sp.]HOZ05143.1 GNAT family N-acetyltransferase [Arenimonas sp.]HPO25736.1 GNAT family N-acetyltransferase [Arenimonas sp.]HPW32687.1 GNAT family N-acetyltransferase [Arenimonas sp.]